MSRIVVFGAGGRAGSRIVREAATRGHQVTAVARTTAQMTELPEGVRAMAGDVTDTDQVHALASDADVLVLAVGGTQPELYPNAVKSVIAASRSLGAAAPRIIHMGGGASLLRPDGTRFIDSPDFPEFVRPLALRQIEALDTYRRADDVAWIYVSPPPLHFAPGQRTGHYRTGLDQPVTGDDGQARISYEDFAVAIVDEIEHSKHLNRRFTVGY